MGTFWQLNERDGSTITWHDGRTGGYSRFLGPNRERGRGVVVLSDVATERTDELGMRLARGPCGDISGVAGAPRPSL